MATKPFTSTDHRYPALVYTWRYLRVDGGAIVID